MSVAISNGVVLKMGTTPVAHLTKIDGLKLSAETVDVTALDSTGNYAEFIGGQKDGGEVSVEGYFDASDAGQTAIKTAYESGAATECEITFPTAMAKKWTFNAVVTAFETGFGVNEVVSFKATLKVSGAPSLEAVAGA